MADPEHDQPPVGADAALRAVLEHLTLHVRRTARLLELRVAAGGLEAPPSGRELSDEALALHERQVAEVERDAAAAGVPLPLVLLRERFDLSPFEYETLALVAACEFDERSARLLATLRGGARYGYVDPQIASALFAADPTERVVVQAAFERDGALLRAGVLRALPVEGLAPYRATVCLALAAHARAFLRGGRALGDAVAAVGRRVVPGVAVEQLPGLERLVGDLVRLVGGFYRLSRRGDPLAAEGVFDVPRGALVALAGDPGTGRAVALRAAARTAGRAIIELDGAALAGRRDWPDVLADALAEAELYGELLHLRAAHALLGGGTATTDAALLARAVDPRAVLVVLSHAGLQLPSPVEERVLARLAFPARLPARDLALAWQTNIPLSVELDGDVDFRRLADGYPLRAGDVRNAVRLAALWSAETRAEGEPARVSHGRLEEAARAQRRASMDGLTSQDPVTVRWTLADIVVTDEVREQVREIVQAAASRMTVMRDWGFEGVIGRGGGIICLFDGPPGTGKTLTSEIIARELGLELHRINVSRIVDKYVGETEKNLARLFEGILPERTVLLFDEADSLFGARVQVSNATDRYANMAVNTLLQLVERFPGVAILTTNLKKSIDTAFERRITYKVRFDPPDEAARVELWRRHLPPGAPLRDDVDLASLARDFELSGGQIKNAVLRAALASASRGALTQAALYEQAWREATSAGLAVRRKPEAPDA